MNINRVKEIRIMQRMILSSVIESWDNILMNTLDLRTFYTMKTDKIYIVRVEFNAGSCEPIAYTILDKFSAKGHKVTKISDRIFKFIEKYKRQGAKGKEVLSL